VVAPTAIPCYRSHRSPERRYANSTALSLTILHSTPIVNRSASQIDELDATLIPCFNMCIAAL
jgi:hypothetical protein